MASRSNDLSVYRRLMRQGRPFWPHLCGLIVLSLLSAGLKLLSPLPLMIGVDCVVGERPLPPVLAGLTGEPDPSHTSLLMIAVVLLVVLTFFVQLIALGSSLLSTYAGEKLVVDFRAALFRHAQRLSLSYHDSRGTTDSTYRIQYDAPCIQWIVVEACIPLMTACFTVISMIYVTAIIDWQLAAVALAVAPILFLLTHIIGRRLRLQSKQLKKLESSALAVVQEVLGGLRVVKAFGQEAREEQRFLSHSRQSLQARLRVIAGAGGLGFLVALTTALGTAAVLYLGVSHVQAGTLTLGELLLVLAYLAQFYAPLETISKKMADLQGSLASADRALALLDATPDVTERPGARPVTRAKGEIAFESVSFAYTNEADVLHDVTFRVPAGARVGITGKTGAGKTTLINLLIRFFDPSQGRILLDGTDLRDYRLEDLRQQYSLVLQEPLLFAVSIAENIAYARPNADGAAIEAAARAANAHDFITALPNGYETLVGERGMQLSGGERQRLALARAFLRDAPILILDEPTSSVDTKTEGRIIEAIERLMEGRTTFMIAHRVSTLAGCDFRLHIDGGRVVHPSSDYDRLTPSQRALEESTARV